MRSDGGIDLGRGVTARIALARPHVAGPGRRSTKTIRLRLARLCCRRHRRHNEVGVLCMLDPTAREKYEGIVPASCLDADLENAEAGGKRLEKLFAGADERLHALMA